MTPGNCIHPPGFTGKQCQLQVDGAVILQFFQFFNSSILQFYGAFLHFFISPFHQFLGGVPTGVVVTDGAF